MSGTKVTGGRDPVRVYTHCLPRGFDRPSAYYRLNAASPHPSVKTACITRASKVRCVP